MTFWRPPQLWPSRAKWWDTKLSRRFGASGLAAVLWVDHFFPGVPNMAANDSDHCRW